MAEQISPLIRITFAGFLVNIVLVILKVACGFWGRSTAIIADGIHSLSDLSTDLALFWGVRAANKPVDKCHDYGHGKIEALVSLGIGLFLCAVGLGILWQGGGKALVILQGGALDSPEWIAVWAAAISVIAKEWLYRKTIFVGRQHNSTAVVANAWHHRSDALSSVGVLLGITGAIILGPKWHILDPLAAVIVSVFIIKAAFSIMKDNVSELIDASLSEVIEEEILNIIRSVEGAEKPHNLRTRRIGKNISIETHIKVDPKLNIVEAHNITTAVEIKLRERFGKDIFVSVHAEPLDKEKGA